MVVVTKKTEQMVLMNVGLWSMTKKTLGQHIRDSESNVSENYPDLSEQDAIDGWSITQMATARDNGTAWVEHSEAMTMIAEEGHFRASYSDEEYSKASIAELASILAGLKDSLDKIGSLKTEIQKELDKVSMAVLPDRMEDEDIQTMKIKGVGRLQLSSDIRCAVPASNREDVKKWLMDNGHGSMVAETINSSTLKAFVKERIKENAEYPEDLLKITPFSKANVVKA